MLLSTAVVYCQNSREEVFPLRALQDSGSQSNLICHEVALALGLKCERVNNSICSVKGTPQFIKNQVSTVVSSKNRQFQKLMEFLVVPKITGLTPTNKLDINGIKNPEYIKLSDENFYSPGRIDLLLSNQIFFEILNSGKLKLADGKLILQDTVFGYVASGVMSHNYTKKCYCGLVTNANELNNSIKRFWEIENCPDFEIPTMSREEKLCEEHFTSTYNRDETGRFIVKMPLSRGPSCLGDSKQMALRRLNSLWRRLVQDPKILELYRNFIREYLEMGHMEEVVEDEDSAIVYYLPHHGVYRQESKATPLRRDLLRIVWKDKIDSRVKTFRLTTVTYGTKSAPYLATRSLKHLAIDDGDKYPLAAEVIMSDVYMDDLLTGADDLESGRKLQVQLVSMLKGAGIEFHKWSASKPLLLPDSMCQVKDLSYSSSTETKTLGLLWKPHPDSFAFKIALMTSYCDNLIITKKSVISTIARIFDPLGLIGPVITRAKILLQSLWQLKLDWNDPLPSNLVSYWKSFIDALESINCLDIPRYCLQDKSIRTELHGFSDSSENAYGALIQVEKSLLGSCAPNQRTFDAFKVNISQIYLWTDSSIVLAWIKKPLAQLKTFAPADILSRGISPDKIQHCELCWFGPPFLHQYKELEPYDITAVEGDDLFLQELKETSDFSLCALLKNFEPLDIISNCSSFTKLQRVIAWCKRFIENARHPMCRTNGPLKSAEATLANIRNSFWIPSARNVVRKTLRTCITCRKVSSKGSQQLMADLPAARVTAYRVFSQVALKRSVARRGRPIEIYSDNGRNFVGANNE
ncbi:integrase catalytic domain-containing protein [Trichonephila clavipes]|nr:integrase catalytic domain-containing protein [Trichonephila clavipes]